MIYAFIKDLQSGKGPNKYDPSEPIYVLELGAGHGKLSFLMAHYLDEMQSYYSPVPRDQIKIVQVEFSESNFAFWYNHPRLTSYYTNNLLYAGNTQTTDHSN